MKFWFIDPYKSFSSDEALDTDNSFERRRINIVVGSNNSSKSTLSRNIYENVTKKSL